jgi:hypothetical protein
MNGIGTLNSVLVLYLHLCAVAFEYKLAPFAFLEQLLREKNLRIAKLFF